LLNTQRYYDPLLEMVEHAIREGFIYPEQRGLLVDDDEPAGLLEQLTTFTPPSGIERWIYR
jgi:hypothetical protein